MFVFQWKKSSFFKTSVLEFATAENNKERWLGEFFGVTISFVEFFI
jgi:hypothetical protein